jgi:hypothetical protein
VNALLVSVLLRWSGAWCTTDFLKLIFPNGLVLILRADLICCSFSVGPGHFLVTISQLAALYLVMEITFREFPILIISYFVIAIAFHQPVVWVVLIDFGMISAVELEKMPRQSYRIRPFGHHLLHYKLFQAHENGLLAPLPLAEND